MSLDPRELQAYREKAAEQVVLIVIVDADTGSLKERVTALEAAGIRQPQERVAFFIPRRNIETWIAYLEGEAVDEDKLKDYRAFKKEHSRTKPAKELARRCAGRAAISRNPLFMLELAIGFEPTTG